LFYAASSSSVYLLLSDVVNQICSFVGKTLITSFPKFYFNKLCLLKNQESRHSFIFIGVFAKLNTIGILLYDRLSRPDSTRIAPGLL